MTLLIYTILISIIVSSFYLSLTVSHIYLYFIFIIASGVVVKRYVYVIYAAYINFYWVIYLYNFIFIYNFYIITCCLFQLNFFINNYY